MSFRWAVLGQLSAPEWHALAMLRQQVFIVEQCCPYPDLDSLDAVSRHLLYRSEDGVLRACLRLVPPGLKYTTPSLGRIVVLASSRGCGLGRRLVAEGLAEHQRCYPGQPNMIGAQVYLEKFYQGFGYECVGAAYAEDGIPHQDMRWWGGR